MGRRTVGECLDEVVELGLDLLVGETELVEDGPLHLGGVDTLGSGTELIAVQAEVEARSSALGIVDVAQGQDERVVERVVLAGDGVDLEQGVLVHPEEHELVVRDHVEVLCNLLPEESSALVGGLPGSCDEEHEVALLGAEGLLDVLEDLGGEVLGDVAGEDTVLAPHPGESSESYLLGVLDVPVDLVPADLSVLLLDADSGDDSSLGEDALEDLVGDVLHDVGELDPLESIPHVGLVGSEPLHGVAVADVGEGGLEVGAVEALPDVGDHALDEVLDVLAVDEGHLEVQLGELGLPVLTGVLVAEAPGDLVVPVHASDHEHLFELLGGLGQGVEGSGVDTGGDDVVPGSLGGGPSEHGGLDLQESLALQVDPGEVDELAPELHAPDHLGPPEVEVPVLHTGVLVGEDSFLLVSDFEGRELGFGEELGLGDEDLDLSGGVALDGGTLDPLPDGSLDEDAGLAGEGVHDALDLLPVGAGREVLGVEDHLGDSVPVRQIDECDSSVVPRKPYPAFKTDLFSDIGGPEFSASVSSSH